MKPYDLIIVGSGIAGIGLAKKVRSLSADIRILMVTESNADNYYKPDLSTAMSNQKTPEGLVLESAQQWAVSNDIELIEFAKITDVDPHLKAVVVNDIFLGYKRLVLATGATPKLDLADKLTGVRHHFWNHWSDFKCFYQQSTHSKSIVIIGGGMIGVELACDLALAGKDVTLLSRGLLMSSVLPEKLSLFLTERLARAGVQVLTHQSIKSVREETTIEIELASGNTLACEELIVATGLTPRVDLARQLGCELQDGIVCNNYLETSVKDIYAIGDCAQINGKIDMFVSPIERCIDALALSLVNEPTPYQRQPSPIFLKTPMCPVAIRMDDDQPVEWVITQDEFGATGLAVSAQQRIVGFVVMGSHCRYAAKMTRKLHSYYQAELTEEAI